jgi:uncharacterized protein
VEEDEERLAGLRAITEQLAPGQWDAAREPTRKELAATSVLALSLAEASVKVRQGPPLDDEEDYALPVWAGVLPLHSVWGVPEADPAMTMDLDVPKHISSRIMPIR